MFGTRDYDGVSENDRLLDRNGANCDNRPYGSSGNRLNHAIKNTVDGQHEHAVDGYATRMGYNLSPHSLADIVADNRLDAISFWGGVEDLARQIGCFDTKCGIDARKGIDVHQRTKYGSNEIPLPPEPSLLELYFDGLKDVTIVMLLASAAVSLILEVGVERNLDTGWIEGASIMSTVFLVISVAALTDYMKGKEFRKQQLALESNKSVCVVRNGGDLVHIHPNDLVVGDIISLSVGDIVSGDGVLCQGHELKVDESALTGESAMQTKSTLSTDSKQGGGGSPFIVSGSSIMLGSGKMIVLAVGENSKQGKILARIREEEYTGLSSMSSEGKDDDVDIWKSREKMGFWRSFFTFGVGKSGASLMQKLDVLAVDIGKLGLIVVIFVFAVMLTSWISTEFGSGGVCPSLVKEIACGSEKLCRWSEEGNCIRHWDNDDFVKILRFFITALTILVVAVPEGLPLAVTLALAVSMRRLMKDNNQVKHIDSCETMGSATTICSDKTGTITENRMTVMRLYWMNTELSYVVGRSSDINNLGELAARSAKPAFVQLVCEAIALNSSPHSKVVSEHGLVHYEGNPTECALLKFALQMGCNVNFLRQDHVISGAGCEWGEHQVPFSSEKKCSSWVVHHSNGSGGSGFRIFTKGAPEEIISRCSREIIAVNEDETILFESLSRARQRKLTLQLNQFQSSGLRTLALAYKDATHQDSKDWDAASFGDGYTLIALLGIEDPVRESVPLAIKRCHAAGIDIRMCTGDALPTAVAISKNCGILRPHDLDFRTGIPKAGFAMTGAEFCERVHKKDFNSAKVVRSVYDFKAGKTVTKLAEPFELSENGSKIIDQGAFDDIWPTLRVLARCQPEDKLTLVRGMRASRVFADPDRCSRLLNEHNVSIFPDFQVVAVTGDGTNDAPALKAADVGFAMGIAGTEIAKQACDIVLLDDNFSSIVQAVLWGRNIFDSISKFIQFQLTVNIVAIIVAVTGAFIYNESPLSATQMLWVNLIMDSLASLALATELPTEDLLHRSPYGKRRSIVSKVMYTNIVGQSVFQLGIFFWILFFPDTIPIIGNGIERDPRPESLHWSLFFNVFVMLQLCNEFNCRHLPTVEQLRTSRKHWNVFHGVWSNPMFIFVTVSTFVCQIFIIQFGGPSFGIVSGGLSFAQWCASIVFGLSCLIWQLILNFGMVKTYPSEISERKSQTEFARVHPELFKFRRPSKPICTDLSLAKDRWHTLRRSLHSSSVYASAFRLSLNKGIALRGEAHRKSVLNDEVN